ncbi:conserved hypothetical protein [Frankia canadensis]|uniref:Uncharacterized protein n=1 Tax=Frankia canadensis TaxID=1836972 RepID=A0A2I2KME2_9ACTN|nr:conserved hypothetical protein [Frankia canadensis]SOU54113.1 conserved hypothetical protein [Frankia canadensis]
MDSLAMALNDQYHTEFVFGFDDAFRKHGYRHRPLDRSPKSRRAS